MNNVSISKNRHLSAMAMMAVAIGMICSPAPVSAQSVIPYTNTFESYAPGTVLVDSNGVGIGEWSGPNVGLTTAVAVVSATDPNYYTNAAGYPVPAATHLQAMQFASDISNAFQATEGRTNVTIDLMLQAGQIRDWNDMPSDVQAAVYIATNGHLRIWHNYYNEDYSALNHAWTELEHTPIASGDWVRVTLTMKYLRDAGDNNEQYYSIRLNGELLTHLRGYVNTDDSDFNYWQANSVDQVGPWFLTGSSGYGDDRTPVGPLTQYLSSLSLLGVGSVDDVVVTGSYAPPPVMHPSITGISLPGGGQFVFSATGAADQVYTVMGRSNLLNGSWQQVGVFTADPSGLAIWSDPAATNLPQRFYRLQ